MLIPEAAALLEMKPAALYKAIQRGQLPVTRIGPTVLVHENDLATYRTTKRDPGRPRKAPPPDA